MKKIVLLAIVLFAFKLHSYAYFSAIAPSGQWLYYELEYNSIDGRMYATVTSPYYYSYDNPEPTGNLVIPDSVVYDGITYPVHSIYDEAFYDCIGLTSVTVPSSVTSIGIRAFYNCTGLTSISIPNSVTSIGGYAFYNCSGLTSLIIPNSVTDIGNMALYGLINVIYNGTASGSPWGARAINGFFYGDYIYTDSTMTTIAYYVGNDSAIVIPNSVTSIGESAFRGCTGLTSITIPNSVTSIGNSAFAGCSGLTSITIPNSVTSIGNSAFAGCSGLTSITIPNSVTSIGNLAFNGCSGLISIIIPSSVTNIGEGAFYNCTGLTSITIPVTSIGNYAFYHCTGLTSITIPNSVTSIGNSAFYGCSGLTSIIIPSSITNIEDGVFSNCTGLTSITIPNSVTSIGGGAFYNCTGLTSITIPNSVTSIGESAFRGCTGLTEIISLSNIAPLLMGDYVFEGISRFIDVHIPCGSIVSYSSRWNYFYDFIQATGFSIEVSSADTTTGTVYVISQPTCDSQTAIVLASASAGYIFNNWNDGNIDNPRALTLTSDTSIVAYFALNLPDTVFIHDTSTVTLFDTIFITQFDSIYITVHDTVIEQMTYYTLHVMSANNTYGFAAGNGTFPVGTEVEIAAIPIEGYRFVQWNDGNNENPRLVTANDNMSFAASFEPASVSINIADGNDITITASHNMITVCGAAGERIRLFDILGRQLAICDNAAGMQSFAVPAAGAYLIQVGNRSAQKVVVLR